MTCTCKGTGQSPGSEYLDCRLCGAADERAALNGFILDLPKMPVYDMDWAIHQRAVSQERSIAAANLQRVAELYAVGDSGARMALAAEIARVTK